MTKVLDSDGVSTPRRGAKKPVDLRLSNQWLRVLRALFERGARVRTNQSNRNACTIDGPRLALQSILIKGFKFYSFHYGSWRQTCPPIYTHKGIEILFIPITRHGCHVLLFLVMSGLGNVRACCLPPIRDLNSNSNHKTLVTTTLCRRPLPNLGHSGFVG